jgi:uncharacterized secreted protein with C-terminal beta-propeller domain
MLGKMLATLVVAAAVPAASAAGAAAPALPPRPHTFASCAELAAYAQAHAPGVVAPGLPRAAPGAVAGPERAAGTPGQAPDYSTTNVQEAGVDEPDIVKTDGTYVFAVSGGTLRSLDARAANPRLLDTLTLPEGSSSQLLAHGDRLLVLSSTAAPLPQPLGRRPLLPVLPMRTVLTEVDTSNPAALRVLQTLTVDGSFLTARQVGGTARIVLSSPALVEPAAPHGPAPLPSATLADRRTGRTTTLPLVPCDRVARPVRFSGTGLVTILTVDLDRGLPAVDTDALMTGAGTVYASTDALYVASQSWLTRPFAGTIVPSPSGTTTEIDKFDASQPDRTTFQASGSVSGGLLDQWSLSEYGGDLRVATTTLPLGGPVPTTREAASETAVHVLAQRGARLVEIGSVGGLGKGQRVSAVRFDGPTGYVVTFRQLDPLYTLDLSDPAHPRARGALELRGYSAYLHPVTDGRLLGVGQDATAGGQLLGTQLSLFDVSDLAHPARLDALPLGAGSSQVEFDARAFTYWPATGLAVVPLTSGAFTGAVAVEVTSSRLEELGRISQAGQILRSLVVGPRLLAVSDRGIGVYDLATLTRRGWVAFA